MPGWCLQVTFDLPVEITMQRSEHPEKGRQFKGSGGIPVLRVNSPSACLAGHW